MRNFLARVALVGALVGSFAVGYIANQAQQAPNVPAPVSTVDPVRAFNEGFSDAYYDMCQQGVQSACGWLYN